VTPLEITIVGPGRAGLALALAARRVGHRVGAVAGRDPEGTERAAAALGAKPLAIDEPLGSGDLLVVATSDVAIEAVASVLRDPSGHASAVHLSGFVRVDALRPLADAGLAVGSFHPLQTFPTAEAGADRLTGAHVAVTADEPLRAGLNEFAVSLGAVPFDLEDGAKALYHAAASAAANFPIAAFAMSADLFAEAGVPFEAARPLVEAVVANAFELGPRASLTGPVSRGDIETTVGQLEAVLEAAPEWLPGFIGFVRELGRVSGRREQVADLLERWPGS